jgi:hypothetical protein
MNRRSFFSKVLGAAVAGLAAPHLLTSEYGYSGGALIGALPGSFIQGPFTLADGESLMLRIYMDGDKIAKVVQQHTSKALLEG